MKPIATLIGLAALAMATPALAQQTPAPAAPAAGMYAVKIAVKDFIQQKEQRPALRQLRHLFEAQQFCHETAAARL